MYNLTKEQANKIIEILKKVPIQGNLEELEPYLKEIKDIIKILESPINKK